LVWIEGALSPQEIRDRLVNYDTVFETQLVRYIESCCQGEFMTGSFQSVVEKFEKPNVTEHNNVDPTLTLPVPPPNPCTAEPINDALCQCENCCDLRNWKQAFQDTVDNILLNSNMHGCMNKYGDCTARFPREIHPETSVDHADGRINLKKREPMMNTFTVVLTYLLRCNTDVTCILTGTAVKALVAYITDYISKSGLTTHHVFKAAYDVLLK
ncbi:hypothetical protein AGABI2DRAFT_54784, partial [Agaricus bisporus var. bisporus H97]|uniref:hypothetical protein n=1 Tax=Agaricus bisporus var. bisporus (strain H97 / ATCC MYA-4626 / FGSC 10389) TaxID=936046 RepID=UPI00029F6A36